MSQRAILESLKKKTKSIALIGIGIPDRAARSAIAILTELYRICNMSIGYM